MWRYVRGTQRHIMDTDSLNLPALSTPHAPTHANLSHAQVGPDMAQVINTEADVVTSEGISYGMTAAVHLDHREEFDRLWNWARFRMQQTAGDFSSELAGAARSHGYASACNPGAPARRPPSLSFLPQPTPPITTPP